MSLKLVKAEPVENPEVSLETAEPARVREEVARNTRNFRNSWRNLAKVLGVVWQRKLYREWGYETFDQYTAQEVAIRKHTAMKLIRSYNFLQKEEPECLKHDERTESTPAAAPTLEAVHTLRMAKQKLDGEGYQRVKRELFDQNRSPAEVKKDLTMVMKQRREVDPETERGRKRHVIIKRFLGSLEGFMRDAELLEILPDPVAEELRRAKRSLAGLLEEEKMPGEAA
ncbi:MAG: hypothetical protein GF333_03270 [Candidatus Omnitrophica bacterium]|nr:hypothetical protein [Candidatus Omnitrophota bacterium]